MKKGLRDGWKLQDGSGGGEGHVITDEENGKVQVAVESQWGNGQRWNNEMHYVIWCNVTWLTPLDTMAPPA